MGHIADLVAAGFTPRRDETPGEVAIALRSVRMSVRIDGRDEFGRYLIGEGTAGDEQGGVLWPARDARRPPESGPRPGAPLPTRDLPSWGDAWPAVLVLGSQAPSGNARPGETRERGQEDLAPLGQARPLADERLLADERFSRLDVSTPRPLPRGTIGVVVAATHEHRQVPVFLPTEGGPLVAVNAAGDPELASIVHDLRADDSLDPDRRARLHALVRVARPQDGVVPWPRPDGTGSLAWQLAPAGRDAVGGWGLVAGGAAEALEPLADEPATTPPPNPGGPIATVERLPTREGTVARGGEAGGSGGTVARQAGLVYAAAGAGAGGPLQVGDAADQHRLSDTEDGEPLNSAHLDVRSLFRGAGGDAPLEFRPERYHDPPGGPLHLPVRLRIHPDSRHQWVGGDRAGLWRWETDGAIAFVPGDPPPTPRTPPPPPPPGGPPPQTTPRPTPDGGGTTTGVDPPPGTPGGNPRPPGGTPPGGGGGGGGMLVGPRGGPDGGGGMLVGPRGGRPGGVPAGPEGPAQGSGGTSLPPWWVPDPPSPVPPIGERAWRNWRRYNSTRRLGPGRGGRSGSRGGRGRRPGANERFNPDPQPDGPPDTGSTPEQTDRAAEIRAAEAKIRDAAWLTGPGGATSARVRDLADRHEPFAVSLAPMAIPALLLQAPLLPLGPISGTSFQAGPIDPRKATALSPEAAQAAQHQAPVVLRMEASAAQQGGAHLYATVPCQGRYVGGVANGGLTILPPGNDVRGPGEATSTSLSGFVHGPGVYGGHGKIGEVTGALIDGWRSELLSGNAFAYTPINSSGVPAPTNEMRMQGTVQAGPSDLSVDPTLRLGPSGSPQLQYLVASSQTQLSSDLRLTSFFELGDSSGSLVAAAASLRTRWANARGVYEISEDGAPYEAVARGLGMSEGRWGGEEARLIDPSVLTGTPQGYALVGAGASTAFSSILGGSTTFTSAAIAGEFAGVSTVNAFYTLTRTARFSCAAGRALTAVTTSIVVAGLTGVADPSAGTPDGCYFRCTDGGNLFAITRTGGAETATDTTIAFNSGVAQVRYLRIETSAATVRFFVDGILRATHTTNLPGAGTTHFALVAVEATAASARALRVAWVSGRQRTDS